MKTTWLVAVALAVALATPTGAQAADGLAVTLTPVGLPLGFGVDLTYRLSDRFNVRAGAGLPGEGTGENIEIGDIRYDMTLKFGGVNAFLDWHPFGGNFHVSGGVTTLRDPWTLRARNNSSYVIGGTRFPAEGVGQLTGRIETANTVGPALLVGWGNPVRPGKRWGFVIDLGLVYGGRETFELRATGPLAEDPALIQALKAEATEQSADHLLWPVLKAGVSFQF